MDPEQLVPAPRKPFVEPTISAPIDVLTATSDFSVFGSGLPAPPPKGPK